MAKEKPRCVRTLRGLLTELTRLWALRFTQASHALLGRKNRATKSFFVGYYPKDWWLKRPGSRGTCEPQTWSRRPRSVSRPRRRRCRARRRCCCEYSLLRCLSWQTQSRRAPHGPKNEFLHVFSSVGSLTLKLEHDLGSRWRTCKWPAPMDGHCKYTSTL